MKKLLVVVAVALLFTSVAYAENATFQAGDLSQALSADVQDVVAAKQYFCPMDGFTSDQPGKCEKCGMDLVEKPAVDEAAQAVTEAAKTE